MLKNSVTFSNLLLLLLIQTWLPSLSLFYVFFPFQHRSHISLTHHFMIANLYSLHLFICLTFSFIIDKKPFNDSWQARNPIDKHSKLL